MGGVKLRPVLALTNMSTARYPDVVRFVRTLVWVGTWLDHVVTGLSRELPGDAYVGEPWDVTFEMLCGSIARAMESVAPRDLKRATEVIDLAAARIDQQLRL